MLSGRRSGGERESAFTLYEMLVTLAVGAILVTAALPSWRAHIASTKLNAGTSALIGSLNFARSEAIKRTTPVSVCPSTNGVFCTGTPWAQGWMVFVDEGTPGIVDGDDEVLIGKGGFGADSDFSLGGPNFIQFQPNGGLFGDCGARCLESPHRNISTRRAPLLARILTFLPIGVAQAKGNGEGNDKDDKDNDKENDKSKGVKKQISDPGPPPTSADFSACHGTKGRTISVSPLGRIGVVAGDCSP